MPNDRILQVSAAVYSILMDIAFVNARVPAWMWRLEKAAHGRNEPYVNIFIYYIQIFMHFWLNLFFVNTRFSTRLLLLFDPSLNRPVEKRTTLHKFAQSFFSSARLP
jgi:hypothetical protein